MNGSFQNCLKWIFIHFIQVPGHAHSIQTGPGTSLCSCSGLSLPSRHHSLFLLTIPKQDQESLSAPCPYCLCQAGASCWSVGTMQTQDCYTWSWSCKSWIFYGSFTVRWGPNVGVGDVSPNNSKIKQKKQSHFFCWKLWYHSPILGISSLTRRLNDLWKWVFWAYPLRGGALWAAILC